MKSRKKQSVEQGVPGYGPQVAAMHTPPHAANLFRCGRGPIQNPDVGTQKMKNRMTRQSAYLWVAIVVFACVAGYLTMRSTSLYGPGLSPDSTEYVALARDVSANGFAFLTENKAVVQPPLYPIALAATSSLTGSPVIHAARGINILSSAALVAVILLTVSRVTMSIPVLIVTGILSCFSIPLTGVWSMAWTEPLFILTVSLALLIVGEHKHPVYSPLFAGVLTAAAFFTRYAGIVLLPVVTAFVFLSQTGGAWKRCKSAALYALPPAIMFALYLFRNFALSGTLLGARSPSQLGISDNIDRVKDVILAWFLPWRIHSFATFLLLMCTFIGALTWHHRHHIAHVIRNSERIVLLCAAFSVTYTAFIVWTSTTTAYDHINDRLLSPLYPSLLILLAALLKPESWRNQLVRNLALGVFCLLCVVAPLRTTYSQVNRKAAQGAGGYNSRNWQESELVGYFRQNGQPKEIVFSNSPDALYILADVTAKMSPAKLNYNSNKGTGVTNENMFTEYPSLDGAILVWFKPNWRNYLFTLDDLDTMCDLEEIATFSDGSIWRIRSSNKSVEHYVSPGADAG